MVSSRILQRLLLAALLCGGAIMPALARAPRTSVPSELEAACDGIRLSLFPPQGSAARRPLPLFQRLAILEQAAKTATLPGLRAFCFAEIATLYEEYGDLSEAVEWAEKAAAADPHRYGDLADFYRSETAAAPAFGAWAREKLTARRLSFMAQLKTGYDSNVLQEALHPQVHSNKDDWSATGLLSLSRNWKAGGGQAVTGLRYMESLYASHEEFNLRILGFDQSFGGTFTPAALKTGDTLSWQLGLGADHVTSAGQDFLYDLRLSPGLSFLKGSWKTLFMLNGGLTSNRYYASSSRNQDGETWTVQGGATRLLGHDGQRFLTLSLSGSFDRPGVASSCYDEGQLLLGGALPLGGGFSLRPSCKATLRNYQEAATGLAKREDRLLAGDFTLARKLSALQSLELSASTAENRSNLADNHYRRNTVALAWMLAL